MTFIHFTLNIIVFVGCTEEYQVNNATKPDKGASVPLMHLVCLCYICIKYALRGVDLIFKNIFSFSNRLFYVLP